jgi:hypothetical protein
VTVKVAPALTSTTVTATLIAVGESPSGVSELQCDVSGQGWKAMEQKNVTGYPAGSTFTAEIALGVANGTAQASGYSLAVQVRGVNAAGASAPQNTVITWSDRTRPNVTWLEPPADSAIEVLGGGDEAQIAVRAVVIDDENAAVSAGVRSVTCTNPATGTVQALVAGAGTHEWAGVVALQGIGEHLLLLDAVDNAGNAAPQKTHTVTIRRSGIEGTTPQDYLADLVDYVRNRLLTAKGGSAGVTAAHLESALWQPFGRIAGAGVRRVGPSVTDARINAVRAVIEVLRAYLLSPQAAPIARWPLDEGSGLMAHDVTGAGSDMTLQAVAWGPGRPGAAAAPKLDGARSYMFVAPTPQLELRGQAHTVSVWVNPSGPGGGGAGGFIAEFDEWFGLARIAGTLHLRTDPRSRQLGGGASVDTGVAIPENEWSHIAVSFDGANVRVYRNGTIEKTLTEALAEFTVPKEFRLGAGPAPQQLFFQGSIADVAIYDRTLSAEEIKRLAGHTQPVDVFAAVLASAGYLQQVYEAILVGLGTSSEELRTVSRATAEAREKLAHRLGIQMAAMRPDQLDQMLLSSSATGTRFLSEVNLEELFGLQPLDADPLSAGAATALFQRWQEEALRLTWTAEDLGSGDASDYRLPVLDPDIVRESDIANLLDPRSALVKKLLQSRADWLDTKTSSLARPATGNGLAALVHTELGLDLAAEAKRADEGESVASALAAVPLDFAAFNRLNALAQLPDALTDEEWNDVCAIVVSVLKRREYPAWRAEEHAQGVTLDPTVFQSSPLTPDQIARWRACWSVRAQWEDRIGGRDGQLRSLAAGLSEAVSAAERIALPAVRDAAIELAGKTLAPIAPGARAAADQLATKLCVDLRVGPQLTTTRLDLASAALQLLLDAIDASGELPSSLGLPWVVATGSVSDEPTPAGRSWYDRLLGELSWLRDYGSWLSAIEVFLYPENHLLPSIRNSKSRMFGDLVVALSGEAAPTSADAARQAAALFWDDAGWNKEETPGLPKHNSAEQTKYPYTEELSSSDLQEQQRRLATEGPEKAAANREVYFDLPVLMALSLRDAGQWRAALDWLRIVYDRDRPAGNERWIFPVKAIEGAETTITRNEATWFGGGTIEPHHFASVRGACYERFTLLTLAEILCQWADVEFSAETDETCSHANSLYAQALDVLETVQASYIASVPFIPKNRDLDSLVNHATNGLSKLRSGLNIAGMSRSMGAASEANAPAIPVPTNYRFASLIARAQQLVNAASQIEGTYLASLEKKDNENYQALLAQQDLRVAATHVEIAAQQAQVARSEVEVTTLQLSRSQMQSDTYQSWIEAGRNSYEQEMLGAYQDQKHLRMWASQAQAAAAVLQALASATNNGIFGFVFSGGANYAAAAVAGAVSAVGIELGAEADLKGIDAQIAAANASYERQRDQWLLNKQLADADVAIGREQRVVAEGRAEVAGAEASLARDAQANAAVKLTFLLTKFTNAELYTWMSGVLAGVYRYLLQQAAAVGRLAEQQLAFERQTPPAGYVKSDYWTPPSTTSAPTTGIRGLTGSARLLEDLTQLDQYAMATNQRKLQLTQTFSLASLAPVDLQRFRRTGVLPFAIPASSFGSPGTYLATIRTVRISIAALIPPSQGVRATLSSGGASRIVTKDVDGFRTATLARLAETIALTSPANATSVFQVDLTPELLLPFEGCGLDLPFELELPKAINSFDYRTIADVQVSVDYTALYDREYATEVVRGLPSRISNSISLNLRDFPDAWYGFVTSARNLVSAAAVPGGTPPVLTAELSVAAGDLPPNVSDAFVEELTLMIVRTGSTPARFSIDHLRKKGAPAPANPTSVNTVEDIVSTRNGSGAAWRQLVGSQTAPVGTWELGLVADPETAVAAAESSIEDLVLVVAYSAALPAWSGAGS